MPEAREEGMLFVGPNYDSLFQLARACTGPHLATVILRSLVHVGFFPIKLLPAAQLHSVAFPQANRSLQDPQTMGALQDRNPLGESHSCCRRLRG